MDSKSSFRLNPPTSITQRELLGLILGCAAAGSASFSHALYAAQAATGEPDARGITRELLSDLAIRDWILLERELPGGGGTPIPRLRYELELADDRNWDEHSGELKTRYVLTEKGRSHCAPMLADLRTRPGRLLRST